MLSLRRIKITELNEHIICKLCFGYFVQATTILECLHTFCKTCILQYLQSSSFCPICEVQVHKTKPLQGLREDKTLQDVVYKLVPGLFREEMDRRVIFYKDHPEAVGDRTEKGLKESRHFFHGRDEISISLEFLPPAHAHAHALGLRPLRGPSYEPPRLGVSKEGGDEGGLSNDEDDEPMLQFPHRRFLKCPASVPVRVLKKFIKVKYGLTSQHRIDIVYAGDCLDQDQHILEILYQYKYAEDGPLRLQYTVISPPISGKKRPRSLSRKATSSVRCSNEPCPKKIKVESPIKVKEEDLSISSVEKKVLQSTPEKQPPEEAEEESAKAENGTLSSSLDSSRDDGDDAMVIDETASSDPSPPEVEEGSSPCKETQAVVSSLSVSGQSLEVVTPPKPTYTVASSLSCGKSIVNSIESLKDFVNSSPSYPTCFPPRPNQAKCAKDAELTKTSDATTTVGNSSVAKPQNESEAKDGTTNGVSTADSSTPMSQIKEIVAPVSQIATSSPSSEMKPTEPVSTSANNNRSVAPEAVPKTESNPPVTTAIVSQASVVSSNVVCQSTVTSKSVDPKVSSTLEKLIDKVPNGTNVVLQPIVSTCSVTNPSTLIANTFATPSIPNPLHNKALVLPPHLITENSYRPHMLKTLPPPPPCGLDPRKPRLGRPPNKFRNFASNMSPRALLRPDMRGMAPQRANGPRAGIYSQQRKIQVVDKKAELAKRQQQAFSKPPTTNVAAQNHIPPHLLSSVMSPPGQMMNHAIYRDAVHSLQNGKSLNSVPNRTDANLPPNLQTSPLLAGMNGIVNKNPKKVLPKSPTENGTIPPGLSVSAINCSSSTETTSQSLPTQSTANSRTSGAKVGSAKSPGRTKNGSNNASIHSIAQSLVNKQMQQKSVPNGVAAPVSNSVPVCTVTAPTTAQNVLGGVLSTMAPTVAAANMENPLASQFPAGFMPALDPALAAAAYGNYQALLLSAQIQSQLMHNQHDAQRKTEASPIDLSPTSKSSAPTNTTTNPSTKSMKASTPNGHKYVPISPKSNATTKSSAVSLKIPNPTSKLSASRNIGKNTASSTSSSTSTKTIIPSVSTASRCTPVTSLVTLRNTSSPISASAPSPQALRSPGLTSVPSPKPAQSPSPTSPSTPSTPTISPPTPEVTITKLPNASSAPATLTSSTSATSTAPTCINTTAPTKMSNTNTVSITKRPSSNNNNNNNNSNSSSVVSAANKFGLTRSPSNASVRHIPNPSFLSHQSEVKNHLAAAKVPVRNTT